MNPLSAIAFRQGSAKLASAGGERIASGIMALHGQGAGDRPSRHLRSDMCTPSPSRRSGPSQAGPTPFFSPTSHRRGSAESAPVATTAASFRFNFRRFALKSRPITTNQRGSLSCASHFSFFPFSFFRWPVACRTPRRAAWPVLSPVLPLRTLWMKTWSLARHLAVLPVRPPVASSWACRPATDPACLTAFGRADASSRTIRADRPGGLFHFRLAVRSGGTACSRKS